MKVILLFETSGSNYQIARRSNTEDQTPQYEYRFVTKKFFSAVIYSEYCGKPPTWPKLYPSLQSSFYLSRVQQGTIRPAVLWDSRIVTERGCSIGAQITVAKKVPSLCVSVTHHSRTRTHKHSLTHSLTHAHTRARTHTHTVCTRFESYWS